MANSTKPGLAAVTTPAVTDLLSVRQSGDTRDKRETLTQVQALVLGIGSSAAPQANVDNLRLDGNTLSTTDANGDLHLTANGSGVVRAENASGYGTLVASQFACLSAGGGQYDVKLDSIARGIVLSTGGKILFSSAGTLGGVATGDIGLIRDAAGGGLLLVTDGSSSIGKLGSGRQVEANTAVAASPNLLLATESRKLLSNEGATAENYHTLPSAAAAMEFVFYCQDSDGIRVVANAGDTIRLAGTVSASAGFARSSAVGSALILTAINATEWVAISIVGVWTVDV